MADDRVILFACILGIFICICSGEIVSVTYDKNSQEYKIHRHEVPEWVALAEFKNDINNTGWAYLDIKTSTNYDDEQQAFAAGMAEASHSASLMHDHWMNTVDGYCTEPYSAYCTKLHTFLQANLDWMNEQIKTNTSTYWHMVKLFLLQVDGLSQGYELSRRSPDWSSLRYSGPGSTNLDPFGFYLFQVGGDLEDLEEALGKPEKSRVFGSGSCSAMIKMFPGNKDLYVSHDTWSTYQSMLRILKRYEFAYTVKDGLGVYIPGYMMTFSSYPGTILSGDDYYLMSTGLATLETTIGNGNSDLWKYVQPTNSVLEGIRVMAANRLATSGRTWSLVFSAYNSGTYNNQWMIVDSNKFKSGSYNMTDVLYVLEQIPNNIEYGDRSDVLMKQGYWPSYNIPYYPTIFNLSGGPAAVAQYGEWFSYDGSPRAKIFKRDFSKVVSMETMMKLMRYNDFQHDPLSKCACSPPYSGENGISARSDLNPANGTYPFGALGHRSHGGTDMKLTNMTMIKDLQFIAIGGPTHDQQPPFQWSKSDFGPKTPHQGHPDIFKFDPIMFDGSINIKKFDRYRG